MARQKAHRARRGSAALGILVGAWSSGTCLAWLMPLVPRFRSHTLGEKASLVEPLPRQRNVKSCPCSPRVVLQATTGPLQALGGWWNETYQFWEELEIWKSTPLREDTAAEAVALVKQLDLVNASLLAWKGRGGSSSTGQDESEINKLLDPVPGLLAAYYWMRITRTFSKKAVKRGLSNTIVYANIGLAAVFFRVVLPRLLAAGTLDDLFDAASAVGIPDRSTLRSMMDVVQGYDFMGKVGVYTLAFVVEKMTMVSEILPIQIGLKTVAPLVFGGLLPGAIGSAVCETLGACCNFAVGRLFLTDKLRELSAFGGPPLGEAKWFGALSKAASEEGFRLVLLLRLAPVLPLPFDSYWYLLGALPVPPEKFALAHFLGCLKTAFLDASFGVLLLTSVSLDSEDVRAQAQQVLLLETAAFAVVAILIGTVATPLANDLLGLNDDSDSDGEEEEAKAKAKAVAEADAQVPVQVVQAGTGTAVAGNVLQPLLKTTRRVD